MTARIHDATIKQLLSDRDFFVGFCRNYLPAECLKTLDFDTAEIVKRLSQKRVLDHIKAMPNDDIMTVKELADYLKIAEKTAYKFASEGKVPCFKVGSAWRFRKSEIDRWISEQEQKSEDKNDGN